MRALIVGASGAGKTSLINALAGKRVKARKTQMIDFVGNCIDTPGEYITMPRFYGYLFVSAQQADIVLMVIAADERRARVPQGLTQAFTRPVVGVVNKIDLPGADLELASRFLKDAGVRGHYYTVSSITGQGVDELRAAIVSLGSKIKAAKGVRGSEEG